MVPTEIARVLPGQYHELHNGRIGSAEAPVAVGLSKYRSPAGLFAVKAGFAEPDEADNEFTWAGLAMQPAVGARVARDKGWDLEPGDVLLASDDWPVAAATLDFTIRSGEFRNWPLEVKCGGARRAEEYGDGLPPEDVEVQGRHQIYVCDAPGVVVVFVVWGQAPRYFPIERDKKIEEWLIHQEREFWGYVERKELPPKIDGSAATRKALLAMATAKGELGGEVTLSPEESEWARQVIRSRAEKKTLEESEKELVNRLHARLGSALYARTDDGALYRAKVIANKGYTREVAPYSYREFREVT